MKTASEERTMKIVVGADPWGLELKQAVKEHLQKLGHEVSDVGGTRETPAKYYDAAVLAAKALQAGQAERAILFCGTGMGMAIVANKFKGVYASVVESPLTAKLCKAINNANVLTLGGLIFTPFTAIQTVDAWLTTTHTQGLEEHADFLKQALKDIAALEENVR
ncbi:MAG: RpiB/LacA/LacB family sugar-phosphate isomerase [Verrucomicrobiota bacterium]